MDEPHLNPEPKPSRLPIAAFALALVALAVALGVALPAALDADDPVRTVSVATPAASATDPVASNDVDPDDRPIATTTRDRVAAAALDATGGGTVADIDRSDDVGEAFEVEVIADRGEVDVALDRHFRQVPNLRFDD